LFDLSKASIWIHYGPEKEEKKECVAGARGSTAGDAYHELWALHAALGLLMPKTKLQAVTTHERPLLIIA
jgi:hypothetical protein